MSPDAGQKPRENMSSDPVKVRVEHNASGWPVSTDGVMIATGERQRAVSTDPLGNFGYVTRLWRAFESGGVAAMAALIPPDVTWRPTAANGRALRGTDALYEFWSSRRIEMPKLRMFHGHGDDVLLEAEYSRAGGGGRTVWLLYRFEGDRLVEAIGFENEAEARSYPALVAP